MKLILKMTTPRAFKELIEIANGSNVRSLLRHARSSSAGSSGVQIIDGMTAHSARFEVSVSIFDNIIRNVVLTCSACAHTSPRCVCHNGLLTSVVAHCGRHMLTNGDRLARWETLILADAELALSDFTKQSSRVVTEKNHYRSSRPRSPPAVAAATAAAASIIAHVTKTPDVHI